MADIKQIELGGTTYSIKDAQARNDIANLGQVAHFGYTAESPYPDLEDTEYTDTTLTVSGQAADAKVTGDKLTELKSNLGTLPVKYTAKTLAEYVAGALKNVAVGNTINLTSFAATGSMKHTSCSITPGEKLSIFTRTYSGQNLYYYYIVDTNGTVLQRGIQGDSTTRARTEIVTVPENATTLYVSTNGGSASGTRVNVFSVGSNNVGDSIEDVAYQKDVYLYDVIMSQIKKGTGAHPTGTYSSMNDCARTDISLLYPPCKIVYSGTGSYVMQVTQYSSNDATTKVKNILEYGCGTECVVDGSTPLYIGVSFQKTSGDTLSSSDLEEIVANFSVKTSRILGNSVKLRIATYNVGNFNYGDNSALGMDDSLVSTKLPTWRKLLGDIKADFMFMQEYVPYIDRSVAVSAESSLFSPIFPYLICTNDVSSTHDGDALASKIRYITVQQHDIQDSIVGMTVRIIHGTVAINGQIINVFCADYPADSTIETYLANAGITDKTALDVRKSFATNTVAVLDLYSNCIFAGDINTKTTAVDDATAVFTTAGYKVANDGYFGWVRTHHGQGYTAEQSYIAGGEHLGQPLDNIIVSSNILVDRIDAYYQAYDLATSDHIPFVADITIP